MRNIKRILSFLLVVAMLACVPVATSAEGEADLIDSEVLHSITMEDRTGLGLAFRIKMNIQGAQINDHNEFVNTTATAVVNGEEYAVVTMGAVMANQATDIANINSLTLADVTGQFVLDVPAQYLCAEPTADFCEFAVRIINLPELALGRAIACRPYIVLEKDGAQSTIYGGGNICTYNTMYYEATPAETPALNVAIADVDERISVSDVAAAYVNYAPTTYVESFKVNFTLENVSANAKTSVGDTITYACKDAEGNVLSTEIVKVDEMMVEDTLDVEFYAPIGTATIEKASANLNYVPDIALPAIGSDIDVTKKKNRIRVSAAEASFNANGTIHVSLTFKNYTSNWITEETDYVQYTYYNAAGTKIKTVTLYIGVIDTKKYPVKTFEFDLPVNAASVKITKSQITYWTEWA